MMGVATAAQQQTPSAGAGATGLSSGAQLPGPVTCLWVVKPRISLYFTHLRALHSPFGPACVPDAHAPIGML